MSQAHSSQVNFNDQQRRIQENRRRQEALAAQQRAAAARAAAERQRQQTLSQLRQQGQQIAAQKAQLNSLARLNRQMGQNINQGLSNVARSKAELQQLSQAIQSSQAKLDRLVIYEQQVRQKMDQLIMDISETKAEAEQSLQEWNLELEKSIQNRQYVEELIVAGRQLDDQAIDLIQKSAKFMGQIEQKEADLKDAFLQMEEVDKDYHAERLKLQFIDTNESLATSAFVTMQALESKRYKLRAVISDDALMAWFEKVDEKGQKREILVKLSKAYHEADEWLEELDISKGFEFDECLDEQEDLMREMEKLGVDYITQSSNFPLPPDRTVEGWKKNLRNRPSQSREKRKN